MTCSEIFHCKWIMLSFVHSVHVGLFPQLSQAGIQIGVVMDRAMSTQINLYTSLFIAGQLDQMALKDPFQLK